MYQRKQNILQTTPLLNQLISFLVILSISSFRSFEEETVLYVKAERSRTQISLLKYSHPKNHSILPSS